MNKKWTVLALTVALSGLTACGANNNAADNNRNNTGMQTRNVRVNNVNNDNNVNRINNGMNVSNRASRSVERLKEVDRAQVIISNNDAYVAVRLANNGTNKNNNNNNNNNTTNNRTSNTLGTGSGPGYNSNGTTTIKGNANRAGVLDTTQNQNGGTTGTNRNFATTNQNGGATDTNINGGTTGTNQNGADIGTNRNFGTTGTNRNFGTTGTNNNYSEVSTALEQRIADRVRATNKKINKVYVSVDNDFYNRMNTYSNDIRNGNNRDGLLNDFNDTVRRMFNR